MNGGGFGPDAYMEPEEEWEREGLLDPAWEKQQKKVTKNHPLPGLAATLSDGALKLCGCRDAEGRCCDREMRAPSHHRSGGWLRSEGLMRVAHRVVCAAEFCGAVLS
jgi:hypothetical protein